MARNEYSALVVNFAITVNDNDCKIGDCIVYRGFSVQDCEILFFSHYGFPVSKNVLYHNLVTLHRRDINAANIESVAYRFEILNVILVENKFRIFEVCQIEEFCQTIDF